MTIKSGLAAIAVVFSVVLLSAPNTFATENTDTKQAEQKPVIVTINPGDSLTTVAEAHGTTYVRIFNANESIANPDIINPGDQVRIPTAEEVLPDRYAELEAQLAAQQPVVTSAATIASIGDQLAYPGATRGYSTDSAGNTYYNGYCTWYAKSRRGDLPNMLGNGGQWVANAAARGLSTGSTPRVGAIAESPGHVAYVEAVHPNGTMTITEMNGPAGFGVVGTRTVPAGGHQFIY